MNKRLTVIAVVIILASGTLAFWKIWTAKVEKEKMLQSSGIQNQAKNDTLEQKKISSPTDPMERDLEDMEADLNTIDESDFGEVELSDQNVGL